MVHIPQALVSFKVRKRKGHICFEWNKCLWHIHIHCIFNIPIFQFNWYTKRVSLAGVYKSTEVYMLQDSSEDYQDSWEFLDRRMEDLTTIGKFARNVCTGYNICIGTHSKCSKSSPRNENLNLLVLEMVPIKFVN